MARDSEIDLFKLIFDYLSNVVIGLDPRYLNLILWSLGIALFVLISYTVFIIFKAKSELNSSRYFLKLTYSSKSMEKSDLILEFVTLLSKLHSLSKGSIITFEIHQNKQFDIANFVITTSKVEVLQSIKQELETIKGLNILNSDADPLFLIQTNTDRSKTKPYVLKLSSSSSYGNFKTDSVVCIKSLIQTLKQLSDSDYGSIVVAFRPSYSQNKIRSQISKLNFKAMRNGKTYGIDHNLVKEVKELETKNISTIFNVGICVISSRSFAVDNLASCFNLLSNQNYFISKSAKFDILKLRYVRADDLFEPLNRASYGSYINCNELACLAQIVDFGAEISYKNTVTKADIPKEKSMTSFKDVL